MFSPEMRRHRYDELINFYITNFQETLHKTEYKGHIPTDTEFRQEMERHKHWSKLGGSTTVFTYYCAAKYVVTCRACESSSELRISFSEIG